MNETRRGRWTEILVLSGLALALSLWGGTPFQQNDSIILKAHKVMETGGNPEFFNYPGLVIYLTAIPYSILHAVLGNDSAFQLLRESNRSFEAPTFSYFFLGHLLSAGFGLLGVLSVRSAARTLLGSSATAFVAGAILATSLLWITDTHVVTVDVPLAALLALTTARTLRVVMRSTPASTIDCVVIGLCAGLATSAKYNGALILLPVTLALIFHVRSMQGGLPRVLSALLIPGVAALVIFLATNPYIVLDFEAFRADFLFEWTHSQTGHAGYIVDNGYAFHFLYSLVPGFGWPGLVAAAVGFALLAKMKSVPFSAKLLLIGFPLAHFLLIGNSKLAFQRYMLPILPFLAVAASVAFDRLLRREGRARIAGLALALMVVAPGLVWGSKHNMLLSKPDIRRELVRALEKAELDLGGVPVYAIGDSARCARWAGLPFQPKNTIASPQIANNATRLYIFDSFLQDRVLYDDPGPEVAPLYSGNENVQLFEQYEDLTVLQLSPFTVPKSLAPLSRKSNYSPSLPDLRVRRRAGPFFELYFKEPEDALRLERACDELGIEVERTTGADGWYFARLRALAKKRDSG